MIAAMTLVVVGCRKTVEVSFENTTQEFDAQGGSIELALKSNGEWSIEAPAEWVTISPRSGNGDATLTLTAEANTTGEARTAEVKAVTKDNTAKLTLTQDAILGDYVNVTPKDIQCDNEGGAFVVELSSNIDWSVSAPEWITCSPAEGTGDASITLTVSPMTEDFIDINSREAQVLIGNLNVFDEVHVVQTAGTDPDPDPDPDPHFLEASPLEFTFPKEGGAQEITISCDTVWVFALECDWLSLSQQSGTGNATVVLTAEPNLLNEPKSCEFHLKSLGLHESFVVHQDAGDDPITAAFDSDTLFVAYSGGFRHIQLTSNTTWNLRTTGAWISLPSVSSGEGDASFDILVDINSDSNDRVCFLNAVHNGRILATLVVVQEGKPDLLETDVTQLDVRPEGGSFVIQLTANQSWTVSVNVDWLHCNPQSGFGSGNITVVVDALPSSEPRTGYIKIAGASGKYVIITVDQH